MAPTTTTIAARISIPLARAISVSEELDAAISTSLDLGRDVLAAHVVRQEVLRADGHSHVRRDGNGTRAVAASNSRPAPLPTPEPSRRQPQYSGQGRQRLTKSKKAGIRKGAGLKSLKHPALPPNISEGNGWNELDSGRRQQSPFRTTAAAILGGTCLFAMQH